MNTETNKTDWTETKRRIQSRFGKLTNESIESLKGNLDKLSEKLQCDYGYAKEQADKESSSFKASLHTATGPANNRGMESGSKGQDEESETRSGKEDEESGTRTGKEDEESETLSGKAGMESGTRSGREGKKVA